MYQISPFLTCICDAYATCLNKSIYDIGMLINDTYEKVTQTNFEMFFDAIYLPLEGVIDQPIQWMLMLMFCSQRNQEIL